MYYVVLKLHVNIMFLCLVNTINKLLLHYTHVMKTVDDTCGNQYTHTYTM